MKTKLLLLVATALLATTLVSCNKDQLNSLDKKVSDLDNRVTNIEKAISNYNNEISALKGLVDALNGYDQIIGVTEIDGGYEIEFSKKGKVQILNGKDGLQGPAGKDGKDGIDGKEGKDGIDGKDGKDGTAPVICIAKDTDGVYYWTINGEWLLDPEGNKVPASGQPGKDGITPMLKINNDYWYVSTDNGENWTRLGRASGSGSGELPQLDVKTDTDGISYWILNEDWLLDSNGKKIPCSGPQGEKGKDGQNGKDGICPLINIVDNNWSVSYDNGLTWIPMLSAASGTGGSLISNIFISDFGKVYFTLASNEVFCLNLADKFDIIFFKDPDRAKKCPDNLIVTAGEPFSLYYMTSCAAKNEPSPTADNLDCVVEAIADNGWKVKNIPHPTAGYTFGELQFIPPVCDIFDDAVSSKVVVIASDGKDRATVRTIHIDQAMAKCKISSTDGFSDELDYNLTKNRQIIELDMFASVNYELVNTSNWVKFIGTKSLKRDKITLEVEENTTGYVRGATLIIGMENYDSIVMRIYQHPFGWKPITGPGSELKGKFQDDMIGPLLFGSSPVYDVNVEGLYSASGTFMGKLRIMNPYDSSYPLYGKSSDMGTWYTAPDMSARHITIDVSDPDNVKLVAPFNSNYMATNGETINGPIIFSNNKSGTFKNNVIEFPIDSFDMTSETDNISGKNLGGFKLAMPGYSLTRNEWTIESLYGTTPKTDFVWNDSTKKYELPALPFEKEETIFICRKGTKSPYLKSKGQMPLLLANTPLDLRYTTEPKNFSDTGSLLRSYENAKFILSFDEANMTLTATSAE